MATSVGTLAPMGSAVQTQESTRLSAVQTGAPWYVWCGVAAVTSATIGGAWDVAWHRSIGRDSFWTPAHIAIYACGLLAAVVCGYLIFATTFGNSERLKSVSVKVLGFRAPLGAFVAAWGGIAMMTSAPFDNWWHAAYGLDVKIVSPPHVVLLLGARAVSIGVLFLILAAMNRAADRGTADFKSLQRLLLYVGGLTVSGQMFFLVESTWEGNLHSASAYGAICIGVPVVLATVWEASRYKWAASTATAIYMVMRITEILVFPLFPAQPKLGPVYFPVTHLVPMKFPILMLPAALALDLFWQWARSRAWKPWHVAAISGVLFLAVLVAVEWPFANFLLSKASENRFFGTIYFGYNAPPTGADRLRQWFNPDAGLTLWYGLGRAALYGSIGTWIGLKFGGWMRAVQR